MAKKNPLAGITAAKKAARPLTLGLWAFTTILGSINVIEKFIATAEYNKWWGVTCGIAAALCLFAVRKYYRAFYGLIEISIGIVLLYKAVPESLIGKGGFSSDFDMTSFQQPTSLEWSLIILQVFAAIFVIIRGLDNIDQWFKLWTERSK